jgi:xanthine dehydrogenase YagR molybdenum-binding subunit
MASDDDDDAKPGEGEPRGLTRRSFLQAGSISIAAVGAATGLVARVGDAAADAIPRPKIVGPGALKIVLDVNGQKRAVEVEPRTTLAEALRIELGLTGTKIVCDRGACSACTVHLDGTPFCACMTLALDVGARKVTTVEGLQRGDELHPVQREFIAHDAMQCGFCTPGMVMSCAALLARTAKPSLDEVKHAVSGNLCRCGTYPKVFAATLAASGQDPPPGSAPSIASQVIDTDSHARVPDDEPPPWPHNASLQVVGQPTARLDGRAKVTGEARYTADVRRPGMLFARRLASPHARAHVKSIDTSAAEKLPGVRAVHVLDHLREGARLRNPTGEPRYPEVRYAGQTIAAVAATSQAIADQAARLIQVVYEPLPFVVDLDEARRPGAPLVYPGPTEQLGTGGGGGAATGLPQHGNVRGPNESHRGDLAAGFRRAAHTVAGEFRTQVQTHSALEPHGVVAEWEGGGLTVWASTQGTASVRNELAEVFGLPQAKVHVITEFMGGGFGAKFGAGTYGVLAAQLAKQAGAPVRLVLDRKDEHTSVGNRPATAHRLKLGALADGALTAMEQESYGTAGIGLGAGVGPWADRIYPAPAFHSAQYDVFTHAAPGCAFRAPGAPITAFAIEQLVDELAERLKIDPLALRDKIDVGEGGKDDRSDREARRRERRIGAERFGWARRRAPAADNGPVKRGLGVAQAIWGRFVNLESSCEVRLHRDGSIEILSSVQDIGTGTRTALGQVVAEELGVRAEQVTVRIGDTAYPIGPSSGGSMTLLAMAAPARTAAFRVRKQLVALAATQLGSPPEELELADGAVRVRGKPGRSIPLRKAAARMRGDAIAARATRSEDFGGPVRDGYGGVQFAEVTVDVETGVVKVQRVVAVHDCGRPVNPLALQSQVNGGVLQGLSWALYEQRQLDRATGRMVNANLDQYKIAGAREAPLIETLLIEQYQGRTGVDANGVGEPVIVATAAAIANAFYNATGVRMRELPMRPPQVLAALRGGRR